MMRCGGEDKRGELEVGGGEDDTEEQEEQGWYVPIG